MQANQDVLSSLAIFGGFYSLMVGGLARASKKSGKPFPGPVQLLKRAITCSQATGYVLFEMLCDVPEEFAYRWAKHFDKAKEW